MTAPERPPAHGRRTVTFWAGVRLGGAGKIVLSVP